MKKLMVLAVLTVFVFYGLEVYAGGTGSTGWSILRRPQSSKPESITAVASIRGDLSGIFYNPSTLGTITRGEIFFLTELGMAEDQFQGAIFGYPLGKGGGIAMGYLSYDAGMTTLYWIDGGSEVEDNVSLQKDSLALLSCGFSLSSHLSMGISLKYATSNIAEQTPDTYAMCGDIGMIYTQGVNGFSVSLAGQNLGTASKFLDETEELPMCAWLGVAYTHMLGTSNFFGLGVDAGYLLGESERGFLPGVGLEYGMGDLSFNLGYYAMKTDEAGMQLGFGFTSGMIEVGYAYLPTQFLNPVHRFNLSFLF